MGGRRSSFITPYKQSEIMGDISKAPLYEILQQLDCHFTWKLPKEDIVFDELEGRIANKIKFSVGRIQQQYNLLAYVKCLNGEKAEALEILQKAEDNVIIEDPEQIGKTSLVTWGNYAWVYYHMDRLAEAHTYIKKVETTCKQHGSASCYRMELPQVCCEKGWAQLMFGQNYIAEAKESFAKALEKEPENPEFNCGYAISVYRLEQNYEKRSAAEGSSLELLKKAAKLNPGDAFVLPLLALKLQKTGKVEEGREFIEEALGKHPGLPYVLRYAAIFYRKKGDVERSLELLKEALSLTPNSGFLHHQMGLCYRAQYFKINASKDPDQDREQMAELIRLCIFHFQKAVEGKPKFVHSYLDLANMYAEGKELQKAEETFQKAYAVRKLTCSEEQKLHFNFGHFQENHKNSEPEAVDLYLAGLRIGSESSEGKKCRCNLKKLIEKRIKEGPVEAKSLGIRGFIHQLDGEKHQAVECYQQALEMDPENEEYGSVLLELRLSIQSETALYEILQQLECHFTWAALVEDMDRDELEERKGENLLSNVGKYNLLAYVKCLNGKNEEALENLQRAEEAVKIEYPEEVEKASLVTWGNYAWVYYRMDRLTEAHTYINKVETTCKGNGGVSTYRMECPQMYYEKGWAQLLSGKNYIAEAKESFAKALEKEPESPEFNSSYAITVYRLEDYYGKKSAAEGSSLEPLKKAAKLNPNDALVLPLLALKLQQTNNTEEAEKCIKDALEKHPSFPYVLRHAAIFYRKNGDVERSLELLKEAWSLTPNSGFLHHQMGLCYRTKYFNIKGSGDREQMAELIRLCILHFEEVVERKPKYVYGHLDLANMYAQGKELQKAEDTFQKVFTMRNLTGAEKQQLHFNYGRFQEYHKKSESKAIEHYLAGLRIESESFPRHQCKRYLKKLIENKIERGTADAKSFGIRGYIHQLDEEKHQAIECYQQALKMDPDNEEYNSALLELEFSVQS